MKGKIQQFKSRFIIGNYFKVNIFKVEVVTNLWRSQGYVYGLVLCIIDYVNVLLIVHNVVSMILLKCYIKPSINSVIYRR